MSKHVHVYICVNKQTNGWRHVHIVYSDSLPVAMHSAFTSVFSPTLSSTASYAGAMVFVHR